MRLTVSGMNAAVSPNRFDHLFGRYVYGFKPQTHCDHCLVSTHATAIAPTMTDGSYQLKDELFYLCGVGNRELKSTMPDMMRRQTNVHLAVRPRRGSSAAIGSVYGVHFVIEDAQAIPIEKPTDELSGLSPEHIGCKMFQFGYQMFDVDGVTSNQGSIIHQLRENWILTPEIPLAKPTR